MSRSKVTDNDIIESISQHSTMRAAALSTGLSFSAFKARAERLGVYIPNQGGRGVSRETSSRTVPLNEILEGKHPTYQTHKLRLRLFKHGIKQQVCEICGTSHWMGEQLSLILDHINGINDDHRLENLRVVCPNCDSMLPTFCGRNKRLKKMVREDGFEPTSHAF